MWIVGTELRRFYTTSRHSSLRDGSRIFECAGTGTEGTRLLEWRICRRPRSTKLLLLFTNCIEDWAKYCGIEKKITNAWCRKTYSQQIRDCSRRWRWERSWWMKNLLWVWRTIRVPSKCGRATVSRDNLFRMNVLHQLWMRSPAAIRAQASRTLSLYQKKSADCTGRLRALPQTTVSVYRAHCALYNAMVEGVEKLTKLIKELRLAENAEYNRRIQSLLLVEMKETVKRTHGMVVEMYEKIMDKPKRQNQLQFDAQEDEENGQIWLLSLSLKWMKNCAMPNIDLTRRNTIEQMSLLHYDQMNHYKQMSHYDPMSLSSLIKWVFFDMIKWVSSIELHVWSHIHLRLSMNIVFNSLKKRCVLSLFPHAPALPPTPGTAALFSPQNGGR